MARGSNARKMSFRDAAESPAIGPELPDGPPITDGHLTQFGHTDDFREMPRFDDPEFDVSVLAGKLSLEETVYAMMARPPKPHHARRHLDVVKLIRCEYRCLRTPSRRNPHHASIMAPVDDEDLEYHRLWWERPNRVTLGDIAERG